MLSGRNEIADGSLRITVGDKGLPDEHSVGASPCVLHHVVGAAHAGFGDANHVVGNQRRDVAEDGAVNL